MSRNGNNRYEVDGHIFLKHVVPAKDLVVMPYSRFFDDMSMRLSGFKSAVQGHYSSYHNDEIYSDMENVEVLTPNSQGNKKIPSSDTKKINPHKGRLIIS